MKEYKNRHDKPLINPGFFHILSAKGNNIYVTDRKQVFVVSIGSESYTYTTREQALEKAIFLRSTR